MSKLTALWRRVFGEPDHIFWERHEQIAAGLPPSKAAVYWANLSKSSAESAVKKSELALKWMVASLALAALSISLRVLVLVGVL